MLANKKTRIIIGAVIALCVLIASSIWVISSMKSNSVDDFEYNNLADGASSSTSLTQIDRIIQNSNNTEDGNDNMYHVYIIYPGSSADAAVETLFKSGTFKQYVINGYRTIDDMMADDKIDVQTFQVGTLNAMGAEDLATTLGKADLIYLYSSSDANVAYTGANAISENLYEVLHNYAFGSNKPLLINYHMQNNGDTPDIVPASEVGKTQLYAMTTSDFKNSWRTARTYNASSWKAGFSGADLCKNDGTGILPDFVESIRSGYKTYSVDENKDWNSYWRRTGTTDTMLNILYVTADSATGDEQMSMARFGSWMTHAGSDMVFTGNTDNRPKEGNTTCVTAKTLTVNDLYVDAEHTIKKYDYIIIAPSANYSLNNDISTEVRAELNSLSNDKNGLTYIVFGTLEDGNNQGGSSSGQEDLTIDTSTNFGKLVDLSVTTNGYAKKSNVLVIGTKFLQTIQSDPEKNPTKIGQLATLLNKSTFRKWSGNGGGGNSGSISTTAFRVLELQPCYPIDKELAASQTITTNVSKYTNATDAGSQYNATKPTGNYYTIPANVLNTSEIDDYKTVDANGNLVMTQEYYQWDLSKAKIAYALGKSIDELELELVQMSTDEFITAKADVSDSYDLIYVGGNMSAFKNSAAYGFAPNNYSTKNWRDYESVFSMYCHTGELTIVNGQRLTKDNPYKYTLMNGNDITYDRLTQMKAYIDNNMPIVFSHEIWQAYEQAKTAGYKNKYMDPDSNMFKLCAYAEKKKSEAGNSSVILDWQNRKLSTQATDALTAANKFFADYYVSDNEQVVDNRQGLYGAASQVTVFNDTLNHELYNCVYGQKSATRPKFAMDTTAVAYVENDTNTELTDRTVTWKLELKDPVAGHTYKAYLLEDQNDNGVFSAGTDEELTSVDFTDGKAELSYTYSDTDFGAFSWKILVKDTTTETAGSYSTITCFAKLDTQDKKEARVLEIMPMTVENCKSENPTNPDGHTFYLDKNYQQSSGNPYLYSSWGTAKNSEYGYCPVLHNPSEYTSDALNFNSNVIAKATKSGNYQGLSDMNMGKYMSTLSINRYDSEKGHEDRDYNYMDLISDEYDFSLDIMYMDDIEYYANAARTSTEKEREEYAEKAEQAYKIYNAYLTEGTNQYESLKKVEDALRQALMDIRDGKGYSGYYTIKNWNGTTTQELKSYPTSDYNTYDIDGMLQSGDYFRFFYLNSSVYHGDNYCQAAGLVYFGAYKPYIEVHDKMVDAYREYRHYSMMAYGPDEYLRKNYDVIAVGFLDDYAGNFKDFSQNAADDLIAFTKETKNAAGQTVPGGSLLMTHDNMTYSNSSTSARTLTATLRPEMGMTPYNHFEIGAGTESSPISKYTATDSGRYFLSNLSSDSSLDLSSSSTATGAAWNSTVSSWMQKASKGTGKLGLLGYSDVFNVYETNNGTTLRYTYAEFQIENAIKYNMQVSGPLNVTGTAKATQVNRGVVTTYPFYIASELRISNTHSQAFALDLENEDVTVWYTLAADSSSSAGQSGGKDYTTMKENSSFYAASPRDGADSYYIYSVGNITYCGAGHALITGDQRDNNDERRLFLNVLVNMANKSTKKPTIEQDIILYDPDGTTKAPGNVVKYDETTDEYSINVNSRTSYPEFGFKVGGSYMKDITNVQIFYDLDYGLGADGEKNDQFTKGVDQMVLDMAYPKGSNLTADQQAAKDLIDNLRAGKVQIIDQVNFPALSTQLKLAEDGKTYIDYFAPYNNKYTYLVIRVTTLKDGVETVLTKRIKVNLNRDLLDLT